MRTNYALLSFNSATLVQWCFASVLGWFSIVSTFYPLMLKLCTYYFVVEIKRRKNRRKLKRSSKRIKMWDTPDEALRCQRVIPEDNVLLWESSQGHSTSLRLAWDNIHYTRRSFWSNWVGKKELVGNHWFLLWVLLKSFAPPRSSRIHWTRSDIL